MKSPSVLLAVAALLLMASSASACVGLYAYGHVHFSGGLSDESGIKYNFDTWGNDWEGHESDGWVCTSGKRQSPIDFPNGPTTGMKGMAKNRNTWDLGSLKSDGTDVQVVNNGVAIQVQWPTKTNYMPSIHVPCDEADCNVLDPVEKNQEVLNGHFEAKPVQFHFHTGSEHTFAGFKGALEMHIVSYADATKVKCDPVVAGKYCIVATGIMFKVAEGMHNPIIQKILDAAPFEEGEINYLPAGEEIDVMGLIPKAAKGTYMQYHGGLTTPPCIEGFLWNVFSDVNYISIEQWERYMELVSFKKCIFENSTDLDDKSMRKLHAHDHEHEYVRTTFVAASADSASERSLLALEEEKSEVEVEGEWDGEYHCYFGAYGYNARQINPRNGRKIINYK